jgi:hypothetical protein
MKNKSVIIFFIILFPLSSFATDTRSKFTLPSKVEVSIIEEPFYKKKFMVEGCSDKGSICRINGHIPFGVAFGVPKTYVKSIVITFHGKSSALDVSDMYNAWGNRPLEYSDKVRYFGGKCFDVNNCQIRGIFSDAAGSFVAEWLIVDGRAIRTVLTGSSDVVDLFIKHIDPPEFD